MAEEKAAKRARKEFSECFDFTTADSIDPSLVWNNPPASSTLEKDTGLRVTPKPGTDYWLKPFHDPPADRATGHGLMYSVPPEAQQCVAETQFSFAQQRAQYDQAGLMVYLDDAHWLKCGIEYVDGVPNMSCVATNDRSDWNYRAWTAGNDIKIRVCLTLYPGVCECKVEHWEGSGDEGKWTFLREAPVVGGPDDIKVGVALCAPKKEDDSEGMEAVFKYLKIKGE